MTNQEANSMTSKELIAFYNAHSTKADRQRYERMKNQTTPEVI